jgi:hypothetical protein
VARSGERVARLVRAHPLRTRCCTAAPFPARYGVTRPAIPSPRLPPHPGRPAPACADPHRLGRSPRSLSAAAGSSAPSRPRRRLPPPEQFRRAAHLPDYRVYEVAGAAHLPGPRNPLDHPAVMRAIFVAADRWLRSGVEPPPSTLMEQAPAGEIDPVYGFATGIARAGDLNAKGGVRLPDLHVGRAQFIALDVSVPVPHYPVSRNRQAPVSGLRPVDSRSTAHRSTWPARRPREPMAMNPDSATTASTCPHSCVRRTTSRPQAFSRRRTRRG